MCGEGGLANSCWVPWGSQSQFLLPLRNIDAPKVSPATRDFEAYLDAILRVSNPGQGIAFIDMRRMTKKDNYIRAAGGEGPGEKGGVGVLRNLSSISICYGPSSNSTSRMEDALYVQK
ncbi:hypothetical protein Tsubulata_008504 [Turnera subulata]|uniref:Uncharacterized protein n=1 Tax=Turnera subulata TaxID=218843 RepID=A0A9Q0G364_9ROSI|nr:hypothetical protein Tsubulata_008504 [Turnera subulata]